MNSFKQLIGYVRKDLGIPEEEVLEVTTEFVQIFHKEFAKYQEKMPESLDFLNEEDFESKTQVSKWFKENFEHENYKLACNNLYSLVCVSQDIIGNEMIKNFGNLEGDNIHEQIQNMFSEGSPLSGLLENSPLADLFKNESLKPMIDNLLEKLKDIDIDKIMKDFQSGDFDMGNIQELLGGIMGGGNNAGLNNMMNMLGPMMGSLGGGAGDSEMAGLTPQQRSKARREKKRTEMRRKVRAREKAKKNGRNKRKKRG